MTAFITPYCKKLKTLLLMLACLLPLWGSAQAAEAIVPQRLQLEVQEGDLTVASRFRITLPGVLQGALQQGVPLTFRLTFDLTHPRSSAYWQQLKNGFEPVASMNFKLSYYSLTSRYRVTIGSLSKSYVTQDEALAAIGSIAGWRVMDVADWSASDQRRIRGSLRLELDISQLPRPFQLKILGADDWALDSGWQTIAHAGAD